MIFCDIALKNTTGLHWWKVTIGLCNGLVLSSNKPIPKTVIGLDLSHYEASLGHNEFIIFTRSNSDSISIRLPAKYA